MSTDRVDPDTTDVGRRLPNRTALWDGLITLWYLTVLVVGITMLVTLELAGRL